MFKTREEAERFYRKFNPERCAEFMVGWSPMQCKRKPGHGPGGLYCKQHGERYAPPEGGETWYRLWGSCITPVTVSKFTDSSVWVRGRRETRHSEYHSYYPTFEEAVAAAVKIENEKRQRAQEQINESSEAIERLRHLRVEDLTSSD